jgi:hypothetical protein
MKNVICAVAIAVFSATLASADCVGGSCSVGPVRKAGASVVSVTKRIVTAPARAVKAVRSNRKCR